MPRIEERGAATSLELDKIKRLISSVGNYSSVVDLAERVLQRISSQVRRFTSELDGLPQKTKKSELIDMIVGKIRFFCDNREDAIEQGMPTKEEHYLAFIELLVSIRKSSSRVWAVYLLRDFPQLDNATTQKIYEEGWDLRIKLKQALKAQGFLAGVQTEVAEERIWFRVAIIKRSKNSTKDREMLRARRPSLVVYFPGEPYFYAMSKMRPELSQAFVSCLGCSGCQELPLSGRHIASLRRMRLGRDGRDGPVGARPDKDRLALARVVEGGRAEKDTQQPLLDKAVVSLSLEFKGREELPENHNLPEGHRLSVSLATVGQDVIGGLLDLVGLGVTTNPAPLWVTNLPTAGRNRVELLEGGRAAPGRQINRGDWDKGSVVSVME